MNLTQTDPNSFFNINRIENWHITYFTYCLSNIKKKNIISSVMCLISISSINIDKIARFNNILIRKPVYLFIYFFRMCEFNKISKKYYSGEDQRGTTKFHYQFSTLWGWHHGYRHGNNTFNVDFKRWTTRSIWLSVQNSRMFLSFLQMIW